MSRVTIQSIADHLGISKFAVSRALTGKSGVSETTRLLVQNAADELGYQNRRRTPVVGKTVEVIFKDRTVASRELWIDVQSGVDSEAVSNGYNMAVRWTDNPNILKRLEANTAGFVLIGPQSPEMFEAIGNSPLPAVVVNHIVPPLLRIDQISATDIEAGVYVARYLADLGHRRVVYAHGRMGYPGRFARLRGFSEAIDAIEDMVLREVSFADDQAASDLRDALLAMVRDNFEPTAFFCGSDGVAVTVVSELMRMGLRVPEDVSVIGHADYGIATQISPQLTTVRMPHREMGVAAVRILLGRAAMSPEFEGLPPQRVSLVPRLVERQSSGPASTRSWRSRLRGLASFSPNGVR
ncbi:LacI family DNA-binding transcriptional regulator [Devosia honganensis]|uniref:LacI family DNA-binding transcriptional regulator n=1 Tax=Devosia honganensis TaxID=1610527 RepID=A0ABV7X3G8_9HYPH